MKNIVFALTLLLLPVLASAQMPKEGVPAVTNVPAKDYPCVDDQHRATFRVVAPEAELVQVDICSKKYPMTRDEN